MAINIDPVPNEPIKETKNWRDWFLFLRVYILTLFNTTATTATAGVATLPANPAGFIVVKINNVNYKIPYYNV